MSKKPCQFFVKNFDSKCYTITVPSPWQEVTVEQFKKLIQKKIGIVPSEQRLIFGGKQLETGTLSDYPALEPQSTVFLVLRLPGGSESELRPFPAGIPKENEACSMCFSSPSIRMPCNHLYCPTCVVEYSWNEANDSRCKREIKCSDCEKEWGLLVIKHYGSVSDEEIRALANKLSENFVKGNTDIRECPGCLCFCERIDNTKSRMQCRMCAKNNKECYYCFHCSLTWKNDPYAVDCGNSNCCAGSDLVVIRTAPKKVINGVTCPSIRLCPKCGSKIEHKVFCKHMKCPSCSTEFCFICLRMKHCGVWQCGRHNDQCAAAPVQTAVPKLVINTVTV